MTEREKWEAGLWYDANFDPELCAEREKAEELYTEFNQTRPSEKAKRAELLHKLLRTKFRPEFINRLDEIVFFNALSDADMHGIVDLLIADLAKRLQANRLNLSVSESAKAAIIKNGADPLFGARPLKRLVQREVVDAIAAAIIDGTVREGDQVTVDVDKDGGFTVVCDNTPAATYEVPDTE